MEVLVGIGQAPRVGLAELDLGRKARCLEPFRHDVDAMQPRCRNAVREHPSEPVTAPAANVQDSALTVHRFRGSRS